MKDQRETILFSAMSLDGYIAKEDGNIDWLFELPNPDKSDYRFRCSRCCSIREFLFPVPAWMRSASNLSEAKSMNRAS